jgi:hypothetical protein
VLHDEALEPAIVLLMRAADEGKASNSNEVKARSSECCGGEG